MLLNFLRLTWLFSAFFTSFASPYGNIGCRFSAVCKDIEECVDDNLFGSCISSEPVTLPYYDVSVNGFRDLKIVIKLLLDRGYQWKDEAAQKTLETILEPFRIDYLDPQVELGQNLRQARELEELENMARQYDRLFGNRKTSARLMDGRSQHDGGPANYDARDKRDYFESDPEIRPTNEDDLEDLIREYVQAIEISPNLMQDEVNWLYHEYYQQYLDLLEQYRAAKEAEQNGLLEDEGTGELTSDYYARVQDKLDYLKQYLEELYTKVGEEEDSVEEEDEEENAGEETDGGMVEGGGGGGMSDTESSWWVPSSSSSIVSEAGLEDVLNEEIDHLAVQLITNEVIPEMSPTEQEQWRMLNEEEKEGIIQEALEAIDWATKELEEGQELDREMTVREEEAIEAGMADGDGERILPMVEGDEGDEDEANIDHPIFQPDEESAQDAIQLDVLEPAAKKADLEDKRGDAVTVPVGAVQDEPLAAGGDEGEDSGETVTKETLSSGYVFITFSETINEEEAEAIVDALASILDIPADVFSDVKVKGKQITVHTNTSSSGLTPTSIAVQIADARESLAAMMGVHEEVTGVGHDPVKVVSSGGQDNAALVILTVVLVACVVGILVAIITVYCLRRRANEKAKVTGLKQGEGNEDEASADYQDLCRQRMATKSEKPEPLTRVSSVAASDGAQPSPSSRSSTSSWSEEPVQSNMDISTGHVVLSYMEDHLNNKDRMGKEWDALCHYEADPCTTDVGKTPENIDKNRVKTALPYDHTRVKLNESVSVSKSDYVNASAIMDIDPRAPAYIATQAPLSNTLADFWQMVWEQGSVVIVNLTHVSETDINRCRYWPDEGSALYHVYEVHLVSEHVWCEDYLVRSFYLKNLETQETRTVTQFHFLTWPENGVPPSPKSLLEFRRKVNKSFRGRACPIVVHCSDGVGRTGTYCLLDLVLTRMLKGVKELDIAATLEHIRDQRPGMVQTKAQFEFALTAVVEEVNAILKALPQ